MMIAVKSISNIHIKNLYGLKMGFAGRDSSVGENVIIMETRANLRLVSFTATCSFVIAATV